MRTAIRDSGLCHPGNAPADWLLIPGVSFGPKRDYLYAGDRLAVQLDWSEGESPVREFVAVDHLNSTRAIVDDNGIVEKIDYLPFGGFLTGGPVPDTTHLFTGHERDTATLASNLDYMHARYFSANLGRFLSVDSVGGEVGSSQSWNRYSYVRNNPVNLVDPTGEFPFVLVGAILGAIWAAEWANAPTSPNDPTLTAPETENRGLAMFKGGVAGAVVGAAIDSAVDRMMPSHDLKRDGPGTSDTRTKKVSPAEGAAGPHTSFKTDQGGKVTGYTEYDAQGLPVKRFRGQGSGQGQSGHGGVEPPLILEPKEGKGPGSPPKVPRKPRPDELPPGYDENG